MTLMPDGSTGQEEGTFIAATLAHSGNAITTVNKEQRGQVAIFTKTDNQGHSKHEPWDAGNGEKANSDRRVFLIKATNAGSMQSSQHGNAPTHPDGHHEPNGSAIAWSHSTGNHAFGPIH